MSAADFFTFLRASLSHLETEVPEAMVRSRMAHGELRSIDADAAREMPGVQMIITAADLDARPRDARDSARTRRRPKQPVNNSRPR